MPRAAQSSTSNDGQVTTSLNGNRRAGIDAHRRLDSPPMKRTTKRAPSGNGTSTPSRPIIGLHLDLKGVAFRPNYIPQLFADLRSQRVNLVLVEYEDVFPFNGIDIA